MNLEPGTLLAGRYRVGECVADDDEVALYLADDEAAQPAECRMNRWDVFALLVAIVPAEAGPSSYEWYPRLRRLFDTLPRELVGPKSRRKLLFSTAERAGPVLCSVFVSVGYPLHRERKGNFASKTRRAVLEADGFRCRKCGTTEGLEVDHIVPLYQGGKPTFENAQTLCAPCHKDKTCQDLSRHKAHRFGPGEDIKRVFRKR